MIKGYYACAFFKFDVQSEWKCHRCWQLLTNPEIMELFLEDGHIIPYFRKSTGLRFYRYSWANLTFFKKRFNTCRPSLDFSSFGVALNQRYVMLHMLYYCTALNDFILFYLKADWPRASWPVRPPFQGPMFGPAELNCFGRTHRKNKVLTYIISLPVLFRISYRLYIEFLLGFSFHLFVCLKKLFTCFLSSGKYTSCRQFCDWPDNVPFIFQTRRQRWDKKIGSQQVCQLFLSTISKLLLLLPIAQDWRLAAATQMVYWWIASKGMQKIADWLARPRSTGWPWKGQNVNPIRGALYVNFFLCYSMILFLLCQFYFISVHNHYLHKYSMLIFMIATSKSCPSVMQLPIPC